MKTSITKTNILKALAFAFIFLLGKNMNAQCTSSFNYTINANGNVSFQSTSTPTTLNHSWFFGNSQSSTLMNPSVTYTANGIYTVSLFTWNSPTTCSASAQQTILITNAPTSTCNLNASFTKTVGANGSVFFTNTSTNTSTLTFYHWTINNNFFSTVQNPTTTLSNGTYTICMNVNDSLNNCFDSYCDVVTISNSTTSACTANFTYTINANGNVSFQSTSSPTTVNHYWTFGNNQTSTLTSPSITYTANGTYVVSLFIWNAAWTCSTSIQQTITITNAATSTCNLNANYTYTVWGNGNISYASTSTGTNNNTVYSWSFGNNQTANTPNATTTYTSNGWYNVCLFISDSTNTCTDSYCSWVYVSTASSSLCNASFTYSVGANGSVTLTSNSTGTTNNTHYVWTVNNNTSTTTTQPQINTTFTNYYTNVCLTIIDSTSNCWSTYCDSIIIPSNPCNASVSFVMAQDSTQALTWWAWANYPSNTTNAVWSWGDNTSSTGFYPSHTYSASGFYNICVTISVSCAGTASFCSNTFINKSAEAQMPMYHVNVVNAQAPTSVKNYAAKESMTDITLYPNPAKDQSHLKLNMNEAGDVTLSIYEITGKLVQQGTHNLSEGVNTIDMDTNSLAKGMYLVTINSGNAKKTVRLIKE